MTDIITTGLNTTLNMDDVANVYLARYEEQLLAQQADVRNKIRTVEAAKAALLKVVTEQAKSDVLAALATVSSPALQFEISGDPGFDESGIVLHVTQTFEVPAGLTLYTSYHRRGHNETKMQNSYNVVIAVSQEHKLKADELDQEHQTLSDALKDLNTNLQNIDRKTRQVKAILSANKLKDMGQTDLIDLPEINALLQIK